MNGRNKGSVKNKNKEEIYKRGGKRHENVRHEKGRSNENHGNHTLSR